jgi:hypothetical protein
MTRGIAEIAQGASAQLDCPGLGSRSSASTRRCRHSDRDRRGRDRGRGRVTFARPANEARAELANAVTTLREAARVADGSAAEIRELQEATAAWTTSRR